MSHYTLLLSRSSYSNAHGIINVMSQQALRMLRCRRRVASIFALCSYVLYIILKVRRFYFFCRAPRRPTPRVRVDVFLSPSFFLRFASSRSSSISLRVPCRVPTSQRLPSRSGYHESNAGASRELYSHRSGGWWRRALMYISRLTRKRARGRRTCWGKSKSILYMYLAA